MKITWRRQLAMAVLAGGMMWACGCSCVSEPAKIPAESAFWQKYGEWEKLPKSDPQRKALLTELVKGLYAVRLEPKDGFSPRSVAEIQAELDKCCPNGDWRDAAGKNTLLRTHARFGMFYGSLMTSKPEVLKSALAKSPTLKFASQWNATPEWFVCQVNMLSQTNPMTPELLAQCPTVVETFPRQGETVDADKVKELRVTYNRDMNTFGNWSFCSVSNETFPDGIAKPHWLDDRTCAKSVRLVPGTTYSVTFNAGRFSSFTGANGLSAVSYKLTFKTAGSNPETAITEKPVVVTTFPRHGEIVDAKNVKELRVTFSQDMNTDEHWSFPSGDGDYPKFNLTDPRWSDPRTCVIPVTLESGKQYAIWFNRDPYRNFVNKAGNSSVPYLLVFNTK